MLRFVSNAGCRLVSVISEEHLRRMFDGLDRMMVDRKMFKDGIFVRQVYADIALWLGLDTVTYEMVKLAEGLEADQKYINAANIYTELCKNGVYRGEIVEGAYGGSKARLHGFAGLAFKRASDYVNAEIQYHISLREAGNDWSYGGDNHASHNLTNMMTFYDAASYAYLNGLTPRDTTHEKMQSAGFTLAGLLSLSGIKTRGCDLFVYHDCELVNSIKPRYKTKDKAFQAVIHAMAAPTIEEYRNRLSKCQYGSITSVCSPLNGSAAEAQSKMLKCEMKKNKRIARDYCLTCGGCGARATDRTLKRCPCKKVYFCSKECQVICWPVHKLECSVVTNKG